MSDNTIGERMSFMQLDPKSVDALKALKPLIERELPKALDVFYGQVSSFPKTRSFFKDAQHMTAAKGRQQSHWSTIASGGFGDDYVRAVRTIGQTHARIGLEPRWYIGGYAVVLDQLVAAVVKDRWPKGLMSGKSGQAEELGRALSSLIKAALLDMDFSISVYLEAAEEARVASEKAAEERTQQMVVGSIGVGLSKLAEGDLTYRMNDDLPPAYLKLLEDFNGAMDKLQEAMKVITVNADGMTSGAGEISQAADDLSRRTEQQAATLEETAAALDEITATVKRTAEGANQANSVVNTAKADAERSGEVVSQAVTAMNGIDKSAQEISQIIGVIDEIAFQTNLLALNAGVEAARAGDAGRGFAVVASEVRALAQRSAEAAKEIKALISASTTQVKEGVELVGQTGQALQRIVGQVSEITALVSEIAASAQEQATGLTQVNTAVNQMDQVTQQNAAMVEQSTAASHSLAQEAQQLATLVGRFQIGERGAASAARPAARPNGAGRVTEARPGVHAPAPNPVAAARSRVAAFASGGGRASAAAAAPAAQDASWEEF